MRYTTFLFCFVPIMQKKIKSNISVNCHLDLWKERKSNKKFPNCVCL